MRPLHLKILAALVCICGLAAASGIQYKFSPAGKYPGSDYTVPLGVGKSAIVGYYVEQVNGRTIQFAYIQTADKGSGAEPAFESVRPTGSRVAYLSGVNAQGVAVGGYCRIDCGPEAGQYAFIYDHGKITSFNYPRSGPIPVATTAYGINDSGQIVGGFCDKSVACPQGVFNVANHGFLDDHGVFTKLDYPGTIGTTQAFAINDSGQIVGVYETSNGGPFAFLCANGNYQNIDYPNSIYTVASAINNKGVVAGLYEDQNGQVHSFTYKGGSFNQIDYPDANDTSVTGINDRGDIVGIWLPNFPKKGQHNFKGIPVQ